MFYKYEIRNNGIEEILYLYCSLKYEFSNEFLDDDNSIRVSTKNFINTNKIRFHGDKVYLVVDGKIVKYIKLNEIQQRDEKLFVDNFMVNINFEDDSLCEISLREYLLSVLLAKYMNSLESEAIKSMIVLYTTFALKMMQDNNLILSNNRFANYKPRDSYKMNFDNYQDIIELLNNCINQVDGIYLSYNDKYILPFMHFSNSGKTLINKNYPYLSSVKSLWDMASPYYIGIKDYSYADLNKLLGINIDKKSEINIINDTYKKIKLGENIFSLQEIKINLGLLSDDIYIIVNNSSLRFITKGWGNSYGLSIFGACCIAENGSNYADILKYYFPKTKLCKIEKQL